MAFKPVTKKDSFITYVNDACINPGVHLGNCFATGLPSVWLYMKAIGLENEFFTLLQQAEKRPQVYKELIYLLQMTNSNSDYFPQPAENLLKLQIPEAVADAQVGITRPDFKLVFVLSRESLIDVLKSVALNNRMVRFGNKKNSVAVMFKDNEYSIYHAGNTKSLVYTKLNECVDAILNMLPKSKHKDYQVIVLESYSLAAMPVAKLPDAIDYFVKQCKNYTTEQLEECLFICVQANDLDGLKHLQTLGISFNVKKIGVDLLQLAVSQPKPNAPLIDFLIKAGVDRQHALEEVISRRAKNPKDITLKTISDLLHATSSRALLHSIDAPVHVHTPTQPNKRS